MTKARELRVGNVFGLNVSGEVVEANPVAVGDRIRVKLRLQNQATGLEFADCMIEFLCLPDRKFCVWNGRDDHDDDED